MMNLDEDSFIDHNKDYQLYPYRNIVVVHSYNQLDYIYLFSSLHVIKI